jgi:hypothetical protein
MRGESGLWFSPQPFPPGLVGQRHLDSTLFDLRQLDASRLHAREPDTIVGGAREQPGSGLIDIKALVGAQRDATARPLRIPPATLVTWIPVPVDTITPAQDRNTRRMLFATCLALLAMVVVLAIEALA